MIASDFEEVSKYLSLCRSNPTLRVWFNGDDETLSENCSENTSITDSSLLYVVDSLSEHRSISCHELIQSWQQYLPKSQRQQKDKNRRIKFRAEAELSIKLIDDGRAVMTQTRPERMSASTDITEGELRTTRASKIVKELISEYTPDLQRDKDSQASANQTKSPPSNRLIEEDNETLQETRPVEARAHPFRPHVTGALQVELKESRGTGQPCKDDTTVEPSKPCCVCGKPLEPGETSPPVVAQTETSASLENTAAYTEETPSDPGAVAVPVAQPEETISDAGLETTAPNVETISDVGSDVSDTSVPVAETGFDVTDSLPEGSSSDSGSEVLDAPSTETSSTAGEEITEKTLELTEEMNSTATPDINSGIIPEKTTSNTIPDNIDVPTEETVPDVVQTSPDETVSTASQEITDAATAETGSVTESDVNYSIPDTEITGEQPSDTGGRPLLTDVVPSATSMKYCPGAGPSESKEGKIKPCCICPDNKEPKSVAFTDEQPEETMSISGPETRELPVETEADIPSDTMEMEAKDTSAYAEPEALNVDDYSPSVTDTLAEESEMHPCTDTGTKDKLKPCCSCSKSSDDNRSDIIEEQLEETRTELSLDLTDEVRQDTDTDTGPENAAVVIEEAASATNPKITEELASQTSSVTLSRCPGPGADNSLDTCCKCGKPLMRPCADKESTGITADPSKSCCVCSDPLATGIQPPMPVPQGPGTALAMSPPRPVVMPMPSLPPPPPTAIPPQPAVVAMPPPRPPPAMTMPPPGPLPAMVMPPLAPRPAISMPTLPPPVLPPSAPFPPPRLAMPTPPPAGAMPPPRPPPVMAMPPLAPRPAMSMPILPPPAMSPPAPPPPMAMPPPPPAMAMPPRPPPPMGIPPPGPPPPMAMPPPPPAMAMPPRPPPPMAMPPPGPPPPMAMPPPPPAMAMPPRPPPPMAMPPPGPPPPMAMPPPTPAMAMPPRPPPPMGIPPPGPPPPMAMPPPPPAMAMPPRPPPPMAMPPPGPPPPMVMPPPPPAMAMPPRPPPPMAMPPPGPPPPMAMPPPPPAMAMPPRPPPPMAMPPSGPPPPMAIPPPPPAMTMPPRPPPPMAMPPPGPPPPMAMPPPPPAMAMPPRPPPPMAMPPPGPPPPMAMPPPPPAMAMPPRPPPPMAMPPPGAPPAMRMPPPPRPMPPLAPKPAMSMPTLPPPRPIPAPGPRPVVPTSSAYQRPCYSAGPDPSKPCCLCSPPGLSKPLTGLKLAVPMPSTERTTAAPMPTRYSPPAPVSVPTTPASGPGATLGVSALGPRPAKPMPSSYMTPPPMPMPSPSTPSPGPRFAGPMPSPFRPLAPAPSPTMPSTGLIPSMQRANALDSCCTCAGQGESRFDGIKLQSIGTGSRFAEICTGPDEYECGEILTHSKSGASFPCCSSVSNNIQQFTSSKSCNALGPCCKATGPVKAEVELRSIGTGTDKWEVGSTRSCNVVGPCCKESAAEKPAGGLRSICTGPDQYYSSSTVLRFEINSCNSLAQSCKISGAAKSPVELRDIGIGPDELTAIGLKTCDALGPCCKGGESVKSKVELRSIGIGPDQSTTIKKKSCEALGPCCRGGQAGKTKVELRSIGIGPDQSGARKKNSCNQLGPCCKDVASKKAAVEQSMVPGTKSCNKLGPCCKGAEAKKPAVELRTIGIGPDQSMDTGTKSCNKLGPCCKGGGAAKPTVKIRSIGTGPDVRRLDELGSNNALEACCARTQPGKSGIQKRNIGIGPDGNRSKASVLQESHSLKICCSSPSKGFARSRVDKVKLKNTASGQESKTCVSDAKDNNSGVCAPRKIHSSSTEIFSTICWPFTSCTGSGKVNSGVYKANSQTCCDKPCCPTKDLQVNKSQTCCDKPCCPINESQANKNQTTCCEKPCCPTNEIKANMKANTCCDKPCCPTNDLQANKNQAACCAKPCCPANDLQSNNQISACCSKPCCPTNLQANNHQACCNKPCCPNVISPREIYTETCPEKCTVSSQYSQSHFANVELCYCPNNPIPAKAAESCASLNQTAQQQVYKSGLRFKVEPVQYFRPRPKSAKAELPAGPQSGVRFQDDVPCKPCLPKPPCPAELSRTYQRIQALSSVPSCTCTERAVEYDLKQMMAKLGQLAQGSQGLTPARRGYCPGPQPGAPGQAGNATNAPGQAGSTPGQTCFGPGQGGAGGGFGPGSGQPDVCPGAPCLDRGLLSGYGPSKLMKSLQKSKIPKQTPEINAGGNINLTPKSGKKSPALKFKKPTNYKGDTKGVISVEEYEMNKKKKKKSKILSTEVTVPLNATKEKRSLLALKPTQNSQNLASCECREPSTFSMEKFQGFKLEARGKGAAAPQMPPCCSSIFKLNK